MSGARFPNARARLRRTHTAPGVVAAPATLWIWLRDGAFRVRDDAGRWYSEILEDVRSARGFGATPRTVEELMDASALARGVLGARPATELYGDVDTGEGWVREAGADPWPVSAGTIAPVAAQLLTGGREADLDPVGDATYLDRPCQDYRFALTGEESGVPFRSEVRWLVSGPFVLLREVRDARIGELATVTEVLELDEDVVTPADLRP